MLHIIAYGVKHRSLPPYNHNKHEYTIYDFEYLNATKMLFQSEGPTNIGDKSLQVHPLDCEKENDYQVQRSNFHLYIHIKISTSYNYLGINVSSETRNVTNCLVLELCLYMLPPKFKR